jgi:hypothetical protein
MLRYRVIGPAAGLACANVPAGCLSGKLVLPHRIALTQRKPPSVLGRSLEFASLLLVR